MITPKRKSITKSTLSRLLSQAGYVRDAIIVGVSAVYGTGYFVWLIHCRRHRIGLLPLIDAQFIASGLSPFLVIVAFHFCTHYILNQKTIVWQIVTPVSKRTREILALLLFLVLAILFCVEIMSADSWGETSNRGLIIALLFFALPLIVIPLLGTVSKSDRVLARFAQVGFTLCFLIVFGLNLSVIPQEFGGGKPRRANIDVDSNQLSRPTIIQLSNDLATTEESGMLRVWGVEVIFYGSERIFLKVTQSEYRNRLTMLELRRDAVRSIIWLSS